MFEEQQSKYYLNSYAQATKRLFPQFQTIFSSTTRSKSIHEAIKNVYGRKGLTGKKYISLADLAPKGTLNSTIDLEYFLSSSLLHHDSLETIVAAILTDDRFNNMIYDYRDFFTLIDSFETLIVNSTMEEKEQKDLILKIGIQVISYVATNKRQFKRIFHHTGNNKDWSEFGIKTLDKTCAGLKCFFLYCVLADEDLLFSLYTTQLNTNYKDSFYSFVERTMKSSPFYFDLKDEGLELSSYFNNGAIISSEAIHQLSRQFRTLLPAIRKKQSTPFGRMFYNELQAVYDYYAKKPTALSQTHRSNVATYLCINSEEMGKHLVEWDQVKFTIVIKLTLILAFKEAQLYLPEDIMFHIIKIAFGTDEKKALLCRLRSNEYYTKFWACDGSFNQEFQDNNKLVINY